MAISVIQRGEQGNPPGLWLKLGNSTALVDNPLGVGEQSMGLDE